MNKFTVFDMVSGEAFSYKENYATAAWDCHDNDGDGILNAHEDTNGNGVYDLNEDASDLDNPDFVGVNGGIKLKLQLLSDGQTWGIFAKPGENITIHTGQTITIGGSQITVVAPAGSQITGLENVNGHWSDNAVLDSPMENPGAKYFSFGFISEAPPIPYVAGQETLLFKFKMIGACPNSLHLIDNDTDPFNQQPNSQGSNPGNWFEVYDYIADDKITFAGTYAPAAWDCHDNDSDGIPNALEDTNGNGIFDDGVDASDLNAAPQLGLGCIQMKLQLLPDSTGWGVFAKPVNGYLPSANAVAASGHVTIVAPVNFEFGGLESLAGQWSLSSTLYAQPNNPNRKYLTLEMAANATNLDLTAGGVMLFKFDKLGDCPDSLYLLENNIPASLTANELNGTDPSSFTSSGFEYCGVYARKAWRCTSPEMPGGPIFDTGAEGFTGSPQTGTAKLDHDFSEGKKPKMQASQNFTLAPNPAGDFVNILVSANLAEGQNTLTLWDLQGKKLREIALENTTAQLDLSSLPAGAYLVSLAQNGQVVERKKLVKQ